MPIELPAIWTIALNIVGWGLIQLGLAWAFTRMPIGWFAGALSGGSKGGGRVYESVFRIRRWMGLLPDGARLFRAGFPKATLRERSPTYLRRFAQETWRGELCHWAAISCSPVFFLWNPVWADAVIVAYALGANLPCILVQRYNRVRIRRMLGHRARDVRPLP